MGLQGALWSVEPFRAVRSLIKKACDCVFRGGWGPEGGSTLSWTRNGLPSDLALGQQREAAVHAPAPAHPAGLAQLGPAPHSSGQAVWAPTWRWQAWCLSSLCPLNSPELPLPRLESARQRNQVFSQANPCHLGRALPPTKGLLFPVPGGCGARTGWRPSGLWLPGLGTLPPPSFFLPPSLPAPSLAQFHLLQVSKANG